MIITVLGSCRQESLRTLYEITDIQDNISFPHYTKEMLEVIKFCKYGHLTPEQTINTFRTPMLNKIPIIFTEELKNKFENSDLYILEIASKIKYEYNDIYVHHIVTDEQYDVSIKNEVTISYQTKDEIEEDILKIKEELNNKPMLIISHLVTYEKGERYNLAQWVEEICIKYNISFINPIKELKNKNLDLDDFNNLFIKESVLSHYTTEGHKEILKIYNNYIKNLMTK